MGKTTEDDMAWSGKDVASVGTETGTVHEKGERWQGRVLKSLQVTARK